MFYIFYQFPISYHLYIEYIFHSKLVIVRIIHFLNSMSINYRKNQIRVLKTEEGKYYFIKLISNGNLGYIYLGLNKDYEEVTIKMISKGGNEDEKMEKKKFFNIEAKLMRSFDSPYIVKAYNSFETVGFYFLITEYCNMNTLEDYFKYRDRKLSEEDIKGLSLPVAKGLHYLHMRSVCHRDIKPENILIKTPNPPSYDGMQIKLVDFNISKIICDTQEALEHYIEDPKQMETRYGTSKYLNPQIFMFNEKYSLKADVWSFGILLYYLKYGIYPFDLNSEDLKEKLSPGSKIPLPPKDTLGKPLRKLMKMCLQPEEDNRYSIEDIINSEFYGNPCPDIVEEKKPKPDEDEGLTIVLKPPI